MQTEQEYWNQAAEDPEVAIKYIADVGLEECLAAIVPELKGTSVLEIGCGIGRLATPIAETHPDWQLHGIDISTKMLDLAPKSSVKYKLCNDRQIPYPDESFESVYSMLVFQHIDSQSLYDYFLETARVLKHGGVFRFQYVEGNHHGFVDHNHDLVDVTRWLGNARFDIVKTNKGLVHPQWTWITGVKK